MNSRDKLIEYQEKLGVLRGFLKLLIRVKEANVASKEISNQIRDEIKEKLDKVITRFKLISNDPKDVDNLVSLIYNDIDQLIKEYPSVTNIDDLKENNPSIK